jgi:hypothetical protein
MAPPAHITRSVRVPDELRVLRSSRAPEFGPRILFFSGGTPLRPLCRVLEPRPIPDRPSAREHQHRREGAAEHRGGRSDLDPTGSFYASLLANLLPRGVGRAIALAGCPRVYIPNTGSDPEQRGMSVADSVEALLRQVRADAGDDVPLSRVVNLVLLDRAPRHYVMHVDRARLERMGVQVVELELVTESSQPYIHPQRLTETLLSLA